jgi:hypothetical protein
MTSWSDLAVISESLIQGYFGSYAALSIAVYFGFLLLYSYSGVPLNVAFAVLTPMFAVFATVGWLGASAWVVGLSLILLALIAAPVLIKVYTGR